MVTKIDFLSKCKTALSHHFTEFGTITTINVMSEMKLKNLMPMDEVPQALVDECIYTLHHRVKILVGKDHADKLLKEIKE